MRTSGDTTVRATASMRAILVTAVLTGAALVGTAAYAHADEASGNGSRGAHVGHEQSATPTGLTELARPRFTEQLSLP